MELSSHNGSKNHYNRGLYEGSWKGMKKFLEQDRLCPALRGRVTYDFTWYPKFGGCSAVFTVCLDRRAVKKFGYAYAAMALAKKGLDQIRYIDDVKRVPPGEREEYTDLNFSRALGEYRHQPIATSLASDDPIVRMFAIVDRRVGRRTLEKIKDTAEDQPDWLRPFYEARLAADGINAAGIGNREEGKEVSK